MAQAAFSDIRILDLSRVLAGPWATQLLADLGADVIKVERPGGGDDTRQWGPPYISNDQGEQVSAYFLAANRGKRSVAIDISTPEGQSLVRELASISDVLIENYKVGGLRKFGLDYAAMKQVNPRLIYCSISGFGQDGPYSARPGYDFIVQGIGGLMSVTGMPESEGGSPTKVGVALADVVTGFYAASAIMAAVRHRDLTGQGQHIDIALLDSAVSMLANQALNFLTTGNAPSRLGNAHPSIVPYESFPTADRDLAIAVGNDGQFRRLCATIGAPHLADDPRFVTNAARVANRAELIPILRQYFATRGADEWLTALTEAAIPAGAINSIADVFDDPQVRHRQMNIMLKHPLLGDLPGVANPIRFSRTPIVYDRAPPLSGEHSRAVLQQLLGKSEEELARLTRSGVVE